MNFAGRRVAIAGLGVSGMAAAAALAPLGARLALADSDRSRRDRAAQVAAQSDAVVLDPANVAVDELDLVVASPGWPPTEPLLVRARAAGVPVISEVELAWRLRANADADWLTVTGTDGKTTTVKMTRAILQADGRRAQAAGNVGAPLVTAVLDPTVDVFVVELSSFQLHHTTSPRPRAAALLNVAQDHLDWHGSFEAYKQAKGRVFAGVRDALIFNADDPVSRELAAAAKAGQGTLKVGFTLRAPEAGEVGLVGSLLVDRAFSNPHEADGRPLADLADLPQLPGPAPRVPPHLAADALAAAALALAGGASPRGVREGLRAFQLDAHRLEHVDVLAGVRYVDDSKATNAHAAGAALMGFAAGSVVWIAGGLAKGAQFQDLVASRADRLKAAVLIGVDRAPLARALAPCAVPVVEIPDGPAVMSRAVAAATRLAAPGDCVLLAPASASMDQFDSYAQRGAAFREAVAELRRSASCDEKEARP
ncbi:MAG: UDP-N-acetylmuramoyl-L-alanine--D-glutamate ligase [Bifidobacteriaceae bacterium]|nr:UDP-N-acetylmuramoyl-L-alanine--D-glutamate ligase [Bifidobacteriaceae bacterium]